MSTSVPVRVEVIFAIRDARGLTGNQKSLLYAVESRGVAFAKWATLAGDAGLGRDAFYTARRRLVEDGLLVQQRRRNASTTYRVDHEALKRLTGSPDHSGNPESPSVGVPGTRPTMSGTRNSPSENPERKETPKKTPKKTPLTEAAAEAEEVRIAALIAQAPPFDDPPQDTAAIEAELRATTSTRVVGDSARSTPPRTPGPKDPIYDRNAFERVAREEGFDPVTGEYQHRSEGRPTPCSRRR